MSRLILTAPLSGWLTALEDVPDPAFAQRMVGEGAAIDPTDAIVRAPCDGSITMIAKARHALTLRAASGAEILLHIGIDTVGLNGDGLDVRVREDAVVRRGDPLVTIDLDRVARHARSLLTPIVVTDPQQFAVVLTRSKCLVEAGEPFLEIARTGGAPAAPQPALSRPDATGEVTVRLEHGFHARPAARIARSSRLYSSRLVLAANGRTADAGSSVSLMALGVGFGDRVELRGFGTDAEEAVQALIAEIGAGLGEATVRESRPARLAPGGAMRAEDSSPANAHEARGTVASRGVAIGIAHQFAPPQPDVVEAGSGVDYEMAELDRARTTARRRLMAMAGSGNGDILAAQCEFLDDPGLNEDAGRAIRDGKSAGYAWRSAILGAQDQLRQIGNARINERIADLSDVEGQVLHALANGAAAPTIQIPDSAVILAAELLPSQLAALDLSKVAGFCSAAGGPTSHVALLAASMGIPAVVGAGPSILLIANGTRVLLDAEAGRLTIEPDEETIETARNTIAGLRSRRARCLGEAAEDCHTADGLRIEVFANLASLADAERAAESGAEGCGLLRTEFLFHNRATAPSVDEQAAEYRAIAEALSPRPLVIRTLDAGGDKPIPYLPLPREENPLLGLRGLRASLRFPELLRDQLAAIIKVQAELRDAHCRILLPMITEPDEIGVVRKIVDELTGERLQGRIPVGAMIETPASVVLAQALAREADFLSIGTNDLAQYTLAMDRTHPELAGAFDYFHPAVLHQVAAVCNAGKAADCSVSVCGALASDVKAAPVLIGLGVRTLSAVPGVIPELKALIRRLILAECRELARSALAQESAGALRQIVDEFESRRQ